MHLFKIVIIAGLTLFYSAALHAKDLKQSSKLIKGRLENGLTYYIYPNNYPKGEAVYRLFIKSGSLYENEDQRGLAHFLEHMAFNGTAHFPGNTLIKYLESKGAKFGTDFNAHTSMNETVYKLQLPSSELSFIDTTLMILSEWAGGLALDSLQIEEERGVILSEWLLQTGPKYDAQNAFLMELLNNSRYSQRKTIGDTAVIRHFTHTQLRDYYKKWYDPALMAVAVAGDVDPQKTKQLIANRFSGLKSSLKAPVPEYGIENYPDVRVKKLSHEALDKIELSVIQLLDLPAPVKTEEDYLPYLERLLLNRLTKERFASLSFKNPPYSNAGYSYSSFLNAKKILMGSLELVPGKIIPGIINYATETERLFRYGFVPSEIEKVKLKYLNELKRAVESETPRESPVFINEIYADFYAGNRFVDLKDEYKLAKKYMGRIDSVSLVQLLHTLRQPEKTHYLLTSFDRVADELPSEKQLVMIFDSTRSAEIKPYVRNMDLPETLLEKEPAAGKIINKKPIAALEADSLVLSNGARVIFKYSDRDKDRILISGFRKGGLYALDSTDYVSGLYAGSVISLSGAGNFTRDELSHFLAGKSISMRMLIEKTRSGIVGGSNKEDMEEMFRLLYLKWTQPKADSAVFKQTKEKSIESYLTANKTETDQYYRELEQLLNGNDYTKRELTDTVLQTELRYERLLPAFHSAFGAAAGFDFLIIGDCTLEEIKPFIEKYLGGLPGGNSRTSYSYQGGHPSFKEVVFERNAGDNPKSAVSLIFQDCRRPDNLSARELREEIAQEIIRNRLLKTLREEMGMVYSVSVSVSSTQYPAYLRRNVIRFSCRPEDADTLISRTLNELKMMAWQPSGFDTELTDARLNLIKKWKVNVQKNTYWSNAIRNHVYNMKSDWSEITAYDALMNAVTNEEIADVIKKEFLQTPMVKAILHPKNKDNHEFLEN